jgi:hypothetical protein
MGLTLRRAIACQTFEMIPILTTRRYAFLTAHPSFANSSSRCYLGIASMHDRSSRGAAYVTTEATDQSQAPPNHPPA